MLVDSIHPSTLPFYAGVTVELYAHYPKSTNSNINNNTSSISTSQNASEADNAYEASYRVYSGMCVCVCVCVCVCTCIPYSF